MGKSSPKYGGSGRKQGDATTDPTGTVRRAPNGTAIAVHWPSPPSRYPWSIMDAYGAAGYESHDRIAHWPVIGAVPGTPASGAPLLAHGQLAGGKQDAVDPECPPIDDPAFRTIGQMRRIPGREVDALGKSAAVVGVSTHD